MQLTSVGRFHLLQRKLVKSVWGAARGADGSPARYMIMHMAEEGAQRVSSAMMMKCGRIKASANRIL